jgi:hypothetical protein
MYFRDPFKFIPIGGDGGIADIADKFSRNEITSANEIRQGIGMKPRPEAKADALQNSNMVQGTTDLSPGNADVVDGTATDITNQPAIEPPDPGADAMINDLTSTMSEVDAALAGG